MKLKPFIALLSVFTILFSGLGSTVGSNVYADSNTELPTLEEAVEADKHDTFDDAITGEEDIPVIKSKNNLLVRSGNSYVGTTTDPTIVEIRALSAQVIYGGEWENDKYVKTVKHSADGQRFTYRINYAISGLYELDPGEIELRIPKSILRDRNGKLSDFYEMSVPSKQEVEYSIEEIDRDMNYAYYEDGDDLVIYNFREVKAGENGYFELNYVTNKSTYDYKDMGKSDDFQAVMRVHSSDDATGKEATAEAETEKIPVYINTTAVIESQTKKFSSFKTKWDNSWGTAPADADDYYYIQWYVVTKMNATQPYNFTLDDSVVKGTFEPIKYKMSGASTYSDINHVEDQRSRNERTDYVITRLPKSEYEPLMKDKWDVINKSEGTVVPVDGLDPSTKASATAPYKYVYQDMHFHRLPGVGDGINYAKRADGAYRYYNGKAGGPVYEKGIYEWGPVINHWFTNLGMNAGYWTRFDLEDFVSGDITYYDNFDWEMVSFGTIYGWTRPDNLNIDDPASYGKEKVTTELIDDQFWLGKMGQDEWSPEYNTRDTSNLYRLTANDFEISFLRFDVTCRDAVYDSENMRFYGTDNVTYADDEFVEIYVKQGNSDTWQLAGKQNLKTKKITFDDKYVKSWSGDRVDFQSNIIAYKIRTSGIHYYTQIRAVPNGALKPSDYVMHLSREVMSDTSPTAGLFIYNESTHNWFRQNGDLIVEWHEGDDDYFTGSENARHSDIRKKVVSSSNNVKKKTYTITWSVDMQEYFARSESQKEFIEQQSGTFYDLLPAGANFVNGSVSVHNGREYVDDGSVEVRTISNYKDTGRTLLIIQINDRGYGTGTGTDAYNYRIYFDTNHSWDAIKDYGHDVYNPVAYKTGNKRLKEGTNDDGGAIREKDLLKDLTEGDDGETFIYSEREFDIVAITSAASGLRKKVKDDEDPGYVYDTWTQINSDYSYELRWANTFTNKSRDLIFFDSLENYKENGTRPSDWKGTLQGIDLSQIKEKGIAPVVYLSKVENLDLEAHHDLTDTSIWTKLENFGDISKAKAIAIDMRKDVNGNEFVLGVGESVTAQLYMKAPPISPDIPDGYGYPWSYNNIYIHNILVDDLGTEEEFYIHQDHTTIALVITNNFKIHKVNADNTTEDIPGVKFHLSGISDYGNSYDKTFKTDKNGNVTFSKIEKGTYTLRETESPADWLLDREDHKLQIKEDGSVWLDGNKLDESLTYTAKNKPRPHADISIIKKREETEAAAGVVVPNTSFKLEGVSDFGNEILEQGTTDASGRLYFRNIEQGNYTLVETIPNENYVKNFTVWNVRIDDTGAVNITADSDNKDRLWEVTRNNNTFTILNEGRYWSFVLWKTDSENESIYLQGAEYQLTGISDLNTEVNETKTTDEYGKIVFNHLEKGTYLLKETKAPQGLTEQGKLGGNRNYIADPNQYIVKIDEKGKVTIDGLTTNAEGDFVAKNDRALDGRITVIKKWDDGLTGEDANNRPIPKLHLITKEPEGLTRFSVIYTAGDGNFNGKKTNTVVYEPTKILEVGDTVDGPIVNGEILEPTLDGYKFVGWYTDKDLTKEYDPTKYYGKDVKIYPKWEEKPDWVVIDRNKWRISGYTNITAVIQDKNISKEEVLNKEGVKKTDDGSTEYELYSWIENDEYHYWTDASFVKLKSGDSMFRECSSLTDISGLSDWDTSDMTSMSSMFYRCSSLTDISALSGWNTSSVRYMDDMFRECSSLSDVLALSGWDIGSVTTMSYMFQACSSLTDIDLSGWNTSNVINMYGVFYGCRLLPSIDLSGWDTGSVTTMRQMFDACSSLWTIYVSDKWNTDKVNSDSGMFRNCSSLPNFNPSVTDKTNAHYGPGGYLTYKSASTANADKNVESEKSDNILTRLSNFVLGEEVMAAEGDIAEGRYETDDGNYLDWRITADKQLVLGKEGEVQVIPVAYRFPDYSYDWPWDLYEIKEIDGVRTWIPIVTSVRFAGTVKALQDTDGMFSARGYGSNPVTAIDVMGFDTSGATTLQGMFEHSQVSTLDLSLFDTSNVIDMSSMFWDCENLTSLDLSSFDTSNVTDMLGMFGYCSNLKSLDLSSFDTSNVTDMSRMFYDCSNLSKIKLNDSFHDSTQPDSYPKSYIHKYDSNGNPTYDTKVYSSSEMKALNSTTTPSIGGTWVVPGYIEHIDLGDGDYEYISEDPLWEKLDDNTWKYTFEVFDDTIPYWLYEEYISGYSSDAMAPNTIRVNVDEVNKLATIENYKPQEEGNLKITKSAPGSSEKFTFNITLTGDKISGTQVFSDIIFTNGKAKIHLGDGDEKLITGIPAGTSYTVQEVKRGDYESTESGTEGIIQTGETAHASFVNKPVTRTVQPVGLTLKKETSGAFETDNAYKFFMNFTGLDAGKTYILSNNTSFTADSNGSAQVEVSLKAGEEVSLTEIPVGATYRITEEAGDYINSYTVTDANNKNKIASTAGSNTEKNLALFTGEETADEGEAVTIVFTNRLEQNQKIKITKQETGVKTGEAFNFIIEFDNLIPGMAFNSNVGRITADVDGLATKEFQLKDGESVEIEGIPVGTRFKVTETKNRADISYEIVGTKIVKATNSIERDHDLSTEIETVDLNEDNVINFMNEITTTDLEITKTVTGNQGDKSKQFNFTANLVGDNITYVKSNSDGVISEGKFTGNTFTLGHGETIKFSNITYGSAYSITEEDLPEYEESSENASGNAAGQVIKFVNNNEAAVPTRAVGNDYPLGLYLGAAGAAGVIIFILAKRKRKAS